MAYIEKRRQRRSDGTIGPVRWRVRYRTPEGGMRTRTFARKIDAERYCSGIEADLIRDEWCDPRSGRMTVAEFVESHYRRTTTNLEPTTLARDESYLRTHILPVFGAMPLASVDYLSCQAWVNELATRRAPATVVKASQIFGKVLKTAVRSRMIRYNPMAEVSRPRIEESPDVYLTPEQIKALALAMERVAARYRALVWVGCYLGPRIGELAALRWSDVDLEQRTLSINRKIVEVTGLGMLEGPTKTKAGRRTLTIPRNVLAELEEHRGRFPSASLVFTSPDGGPIRANNLRRREWAQAVRLSGIVPVPTFHDMRHTAVSLWVAIGASDLEIAKWAGHRSSQFTKDRYAALFPEAGTLLADRLDALFESATSTPAAPLRLVRTDDVDTDAAEAGGKQPPSP